MGDHDGLESVITIGWNAHSILIPKPFARAQLISAIASLLNIRTPPAI
ncbi:hypothetical protein [Bradyrhizobium liaoningense]|nr:hypothetical protein [Bradyrhizobium liaoningense]MBR0719627.1 hypothetical protein [Bradyrhizobium liaoningense]